MRNILLALSLVGSSSPAAHPWSTLLSKSRSRQIPHHLQLARISTTSKWTPLLASTLRKPIQQLKKAHINVHVYNAIVLLTGEVPTKELRA